MDGEDDEEDQEQMLKLLAQMRSASSQGERTLLELEKATAAEVGGGAGRGAAGVRVVAQVGPEEVRVEPTLLRWRDYVAHYEQQCLPPQQGGAGDFARLTPAAACWQQLYNTSNNNDELPHIDLYSNNNNNSNKSVVVDTAVRRNPYYNASADDTVANARPPAPSSPPSPPQLHHSSSQHSSSQQSQSLHLRLFSPRNRSATAWDSTLQRVGGAPLVVCAVRDREAQRLMEERSVHLLPHHCLKLLEIQLQHTACQQPDALFHLVFCFEDHMALDAHLALDDQWCHSVAGVTTGSVWVSQPGSTLQKMVHGSKHANEQGLRLWRTAFRSRPNPTMVVIDYLVAPHPFMEKWASAHLLARVPEHGFGDQTVYTENTLFAESAEALLGLFSYRETLVSHELTSIRLRSSLTRQTVRTIPLVARRIKVNGYHLFAVTTDERALIYVFDLVNENVPPLVLQYPNGGPTDVIARPVGELKQLCALAVGPDRRVHLWRVRFGAGAGTIENPALPAVSMYGHTDNVTCAEAGPEWIYSGACDANICVWDPSTGQHLLTLQGHTDWIFSLYFNAQTETLLSCSKDGTVRIWPAYSESCLRVIDMKGTRALNCIPSTVKNGICAITLGNNRIAVVDEQFGNVVCVCSGHGGRVLQCIWWRSYIITSSQDQTVRVWDSSTGTCLGIFKAHTDDVTGLCIVGDALYSASDDGTIRMWQLKQFVEDHSIRKRSATVDVGHYKPRNLK